MGVRINIILAYWQDSAKNLDVQQKFSGIGRQFQTAPPVAAEMAMCYERCDTSWWWKDILNVEHKLLLLIFSLFILFYLFLFN